MTTPAGTIKVTLEIDGSKAGDQVTDAITRHVKPATTEVNKLGAELGKVGTGPGLTRVSDDAKKATRSVDDVKKSLAQLNIQQKQLQLKLNDGGNLDAVKRQLDGIKRQKQALDLELTKLPFADKYARGGITDGLTAALDGMATQLPGVTGSVAGFGSSLVAAGGSAAAVAAPIAAVTVALTALAAPAVIGGKALYDLGTKFDDIRDKATTTAGLTGDALDQFTNSVKRIGTTTVAAPLEQINDVAIEVTRNLHLTGKPLEEMTSRLANLQRFGVSVDMNTLGDAFRAFGVQAGEQVPILNSLYESSTKSGMGINEMLGAVARGGAPLRALGLGFTESAAVISAFEKAGLDAGQMLPGLNKSVIGLAKGGKTGAAALADVVGQIRDLNAAGNTAGAQTLAAKLFGSRGGLAFFDAISRGALDLESLSGALQNTGVDINQVAADTADWSERWQLLKNEFTASLEPVGTTVFNAVNDQLKSLADWVSANRETIVRFFENIGEVAITAMDFVLEAVGGIAAAIGELIQPIGDVMGAVNKFQAWQADLRGDHETADELRRQAEGFFGMGEGLKKLGAAAHDFNGPELKQQLRDATNAGLDMMKQTDATRAAVDRLGDAVVQLPNGDIVIKDNTPEAQRRVKELGYTVEKLPDGKIKVNVDTEEADRKLRAFITGWANATIDPTVVTPGQPGSSPPGLLGVPQKATGGAIGGVGGPTADNQLIRASPGEHVLDATDVALMGGQQGVYRFRDALNRGRIRGFAGGGAVDGTGPTSTQEQASLTTVFTTALRPVVDGLTAVKDTISTATAGVISAVKALAASGAVGMAGLTRLPGGTGLSLGAAPTNLHGSHQQIGLLAQAAAGKGLSFAAGADNHAVDTGFHPTGQAGDFSNQKSMGPNTPEMTAFANALLPLAPYIRELIYSGSQYNIYKGQLVPAIDQPGSPYNTAQAGYHGDHVHVAVEDSMASAFAQALAGAGVPAMAAAAAAAAPSGAPLSSAQVQAAATAGAAAGTAAGKTPAEQIKAAADAQIKALDAQTDAVQKAKEERDYQQQLADLRYSADQARKDRDAANADPKKNADDRQEAQRRYDKSLQAITEAQENRAARLQREDVEAQKQAIRDQADAAVAALPGKPEAAKAFNPDDLPYGHPLKILAGFLGGAGMNTNEIGAILGKTAGDAVAAASGVTLPGPLGYPSTPTAPDTAVNTLVEQRNPMALAAMAGLDVPDYTRAGGGASAQDVTGTGQGADPFGRIYSDTSALIDRTFTNLDANEKARHDQVMSALNQIANKLGKDVLAPTIDAGTQAAINSTSQQTAGAIGKAVAGSLPSAAPAGGIMGVVGGLVGGGFAEGGPITGGIPGRDSVPILGMPGEHMLTVADVSALGGQAGVYAFRRALHQRGGVALMASGGAVADATVGADFFGVSQIPIIGTIINVLVNVLLKVIGVQIEARDTMMQMSKDFRDWRGDFKAYDAAGRIASDTSGLTDRSSSSTQEAADERLRVLKLVIDGLVRYIIEQVIVPIAKAVGNALLQVGSGALQGGLGAAFPGGSIVGSVIGSALTAGGSAGIDIIAQVGTALAENAISVGLDGISQLLPSVMPNFTSSLFGGSLLANIADPITALFSGVLGALGTVFTGAFGAATFDDGGIADGVGLLPKATIAPERVLSPQQTASFDRLVAVLERGGTIAGGRTTTIHAPFTVTGGERGGRQVRDRLLELMH